MCIKCDKYEKIIEDLCYDKAFGILTRNGLEYRIPIVNDRKIIILMDFCNVSELNREYGYEVVNNKFFNLFNEFKNNHIIGRCFSGDEIIIITEDEYLINDFKDKSNELNLDFRYSLTKYTNLEKNIEELLCFLNMECVYDCSNSFERPKHRGGGGPIKNDIMRYLSENSHKYECEFVQDINLSDVVITNDVFPEYVLSLKKPMVKRMCSPFWHKDYYYRNDSLNRAATQADKVIFITEYSRQSYYKMCNGKTKSDCVVLHWVDPRVYFKKKTKRIFTEFTFVSSSTDWNREEKRYKDIQRFSEVTNQKILLIGKSQKKVSKNIIEFGYIENPNQMSDIFNMADAFLNFSYRDAATKTVCQAINCGLPVLYASSGGVPEMVKEYGVGILEKEEWNITNIIPHFSDDELNNCFQKFKDQYPDIKTKLELFDGQVFFKRMLDEYFKVIKEII